MLEIDLSKPVEIHWEFKTVDGGWMRCHDEFNFPNVVRFARTLERLGEAQIEGTV